MSCVGKSAQPETRRQVSGHIFSNEYPDLIAHAQLPVRGTDQVHAEHDLVSGLAIAGQRAQGFLSRNAGLLVYSGKRAPHALTGGCERVSANADFLPGVFLVWQATGKYEVGAEPIHWDGRIESFVQFVQRCLTNHEKRERILQPHVNFLVGVSWLYGSGFVFRKCQKPATDLQPGGKPTVILRAHWDGKNFIVPYPGTLSLMGRNFERDLKYIPGKSDFHVVPM